MATIERKATGKETLTLRDCPCCGGDIEVGHCGYSSFNPGWAKCKSKCQREWNFKSVDDEWNAGEQWNELALSIAKRLQAFGLLKVDRKRSISRDFRREDLEDEAAKLLQTLEETLISASHE